MKILKKYLLQYWKLCVLVCLLAIVNQFFSLLDPFIFRHIIDGYATKFNILSKTEFFHGVGFLLLLAVGAAFVSRLAKNFQDYYLNTVTQKLGTQLYTDGIKHSLALPYEVFEDTRSGETLGTLQKVRADSEKYILSVINILLISIVGFIFVTIYAINIYWGVAVIFALTVPIIGIVSYVLTRKIKAVQKVILAETTGLAGSTTESLRNIELVKSLGLVDQEVLRLNTTTERILVLELKKLRYIRSISFVQGTLINAMRTGILFFLLYLVFNKVITFGEFFSLYIYSFFIFGPLQELGTVITNHRDAEVAFNQFEKLLNKEKEHIIENGKVINDIKTLSFNDVSFQYGSADNNALEKVSFSVSAGETIAFVGPSGSGKTSLVKLLVGLYKPKSGIISFNNTPNAEFNINTLRTQFGLVTQDTQLFAGSIRENLLFVQPNATDEECLAAIHKSMADSLLNRAKDGLSTRIGEGGVKVSGGEKQRISIARALLRKPNLLIFDEATSALDSLTEQSITETIKDIGENSEHITILIAHRLSTVMHANRIYVLEKGHVAETGTHEELLNQKGLYYAMWRQQIGER